MSTVPLYYEAQVTAGKLLISHMIVLTHIAPLLQFSVPRECCVVMSSWGGEGGVPSVVGKGMSSGRGRECGLLCLGVGSHQLHYHQM